MPETEFSIWRNKWGALMVYQGPVIPNENERIKAVSNLWAEDVPRHPWKRSSHSLSTLCNKGIIYRRKNWEHPKPGSEHEIEKE